MALLCYNPLARGALAGKPKGNTLGRRSDRAAIMRNNPALDASDALCAKLGHSSADVALAWLASRPGVTPIVGKRTLEQFEANSAAVEITLSDETVAEPDKIFPKPGGAAPPEAHVWQGITQLAGFHNLI